MNDAVVFNSKERDNEKTEKSLFDVISHALWGLPVKHNGECVNLMNLEPPHDIVISVFLNKKVIRVNNPNYMDNANIYRETISKSFGEDYEIVKNYAEDNASENSDEDYRVNEYPIFAE